MVQELLEGFSTTGLIERDSTAKRLYTVDVYRRTVLRAQNLTVSAVAALYLSAGLVAQEALPTPLPFPSPSTVVSEPTPQQLTPVVACLRIPAALIAEEASKSFQHSTPVDRVVLGTHSRGTAVCQGEVHCELGQSDIGAEFVCRIEGTITSQTCGINGPAIIGSDATTRYTAVKPVSFDGRRLLTSPAVLCISTKVSITGIGSTAPRLRGRIVKRVAQRRAAESLPEAEEITRRLTAEELQSHIDREFDQRIASINGKLAARLALLDAFSDSNYKVVVRSRPAFVEVALIPRDLTANAAVSLPQFPLADTVALWIPLPAVNLPEFTDFKLSNQSLRGLLSPSLLLQLDAFKTAKLDSSRVDIERHHGWLGFHFRPALDASQQR